MARARLALDGLSVGDAFGQRFFYPPNVESLIAERAFPKPPWTYTDDTEMALAIIDVLERFGGIDADALAVEFGRRYQTDPWRGYGGTAHGILEAIGAGESWELAARRVFGGQGSMGNGGAMRAAPVGAYWEDDWNMVVDEARRSAQVTHAHAEGQAGAIAVAVAAAWSIRRAAEGGQIPATNLFDIVLAYTPVGATRQGIEHARLLSPELSVETAVGLLGNGVRVTAPDTVPFALWCAARHIDDYEEALWATVSGLGDRDTTCAIVGGIVALGVGTAGLPTDWLAAREPLTPAGG